MKDPHPKLEPDKFNPFFYPIKNKLKLNRDFKKKSKEFLEVIYDRKSSKKFSGFTISNLEEVLFIICKTRSIEIDKTGFLISKRSVPSAGARHPIDLLVSLPSKSRTLSYYNPLDHSLNELEIEKEKLKNFFFKINENIPVENACVIWFSIQVNKTTSKYINAESLYWKDTGALVCAIQLVATYLGFKSCPLGTLATNSFDKLFNCENLCSGGGILIGALEN